MPEKPYVLSFSAGGLLYHESVVVAVTFLAARENWAQAMGEIEKGNLLQSRTSSTAKRKLREIRGRLQKLTCEQLRLVATGSRLDQKLLLWLACCLRYQLLGDFAREVLRGKYLQLETTIERADVERFVETKSVWHPELERLAASTRAKLQTVVMRMLRESEMLSKEGVIQAPVMSDEFQAAIRADSLEHFLFYPVALTA